MTETPFDNRIFPRIRQIAQDPDASLPAFGTISIENLLNWMNAAEIGVLGGHDDSVSEAVQKWAMDNPDFGFETPLISRNDIITALQDGGDLDGILRLADHLANERATYACAWGALTAIERILDISAGEIQSVSRDESRDKLSKDE